MFLPVQATLQAVPLHNSKRLPILKFSYGSFVLTSSVLLIFFCSLSNRLKNFCACDRTWEAVLVSTTCSTIFQFFPWIKRPEPFQIKHTLHKPLVFLLCPSPCFLVITFMLFPSHELQRSPIIINWTYIWKYRVRNTETICISEVSRWFWYAESHRFIHSAFSMPQAKKIDLTGKLKPYPTTIYFFRQVLSYFLIKSQY